MTCLPSDDGLVSPFTRGFLGVGVQPTGSVESLLDDIVSRWSLDEVSTATRVDSVGSNDLTDVNEDVTQVAGKLTNAAGFGGGSERLTCSPTTGLPTGALTVQAWVYLGDAGGIVSVIARHGTVGTRAWLLSYNSVAFQFQVSTDGTNYAAVVTAGAPTINTWTHVLAWHDPGAQVIGLQVDGGEAQTAAFAGGLSELATAFDLGGTADGAFRLDEVVIWSAVKSATSRASLYNGGTGIAWPY